MSVREVDGRRGPRPLGRPGRKFVVASMRPIVKRDRKREIWPEKRKNRYARERIRPEKSIK